MSCRGGILIVAFIVTQPTSGAELESKSICCSLSQPINEHGWISWREIEGKKCWYAGRPGKAKSELRWCTIVAPMHHPEAPPVLERSPPADLEPGVVPVQGGFEDRWNGLEGCRKNERVSDCR